MEFLSFLSAIVTFVGHLNAEDSIQGYDIYSSTIADVLSDPALRTPICVGLYAKWGSGKSFLIERLQSRLYFYYPAQEHRTINLIS